MLKALIKQKPVLICIWTYFLYFLSLSMQEPAEYILDFPKYNNPLNVSVVSPASKNYFMLLGDWGAHSETDRAVQEAIARKMIDLHRKRKKEGYNLLFIVTLGDNFYYGGLDDSCDFYIKRWFDIYAELATDYQWLVVKGNHDWGQEDGNAICAWGAKHIRYIDPVTGIPYSANQINHHKKGCNPVNYYLPDFGYFYRLDELSLELIFLEETSTVCPDGMGKQTFLSCDNSTKIGCNYLGKMKKASEKMMDRRAHISDNNNFLIVQHFPQNGQRLLTRFKVNREEHINYYNDDRKDTIWSIYGHTHLQQCDKYSDINSSICESIMSGGGGGCCSEDTLRGFYVIGFNDNKEMIQPFELDDQVISCQYPCNGTNVTLSGDSYNYNYNYQRTEGGWYGGEYVTRKQIDESEFEHCCYAFNPLFNAEKKDKCAMFDLNSC